MINHRGGNLLWIREGFRQYFITQIILCWDRGVTFILLVGWRRRYGSSMLESPLLLKYITGGNQILLDKRIWLLIIFQLVIRVEEILIDEEKEKGRRGRTESIRARDSSLFRLIQVTCCSKMSKLDRLSIVFDNSSIT